MSLIIKQSVSTKDLIVEDWGVLDYNEAYKRQKEIHAKRVKDLIPDTLILVEHYPVLTIGKHGDLKNLLVDDKVLFKRKIKCYKIERGGDITIHNPGQLVCYPIIKLKTYRIGIKKFIYSLEEIIQKTLLKFGINAQTCHPFIGVFVGTQKIASIGIAALNGVTLHGFALNVSNDLSDFKMINPCGLKNLEITSITNTLGYSIDMNVVKQEVIDQFKNSILNYSR
jgi:lipoate-protein ligase B